MLFTRCRLALDMIKFEHSIFALPFALTGALLAFREGGFSHQGVGRTLVWIIVAMVAARSAAMGFNRVVDAEIDSKNPRTKMRHIPAGQLTRKFGIGLIIIASLAFIIAASQLNPLCFYLSPLALAIVFVYSFTKRFTSLSHLVLGFALGIAPAAAWIAVRGSLDARILLLTAAVTFWTAGFDIIYSCQDYQFDCETGLFSIPSRIGIGPALMVARVLHIAMIVCLLVLIEVMHLGSIATLGVGAICALLIYEHSLVKANDLSRVDAAFFTMNGWVSVLFFVFWAADVWLRRAAI